VGVITRHKGIDRSTEAGLYKMRLTRLLERNYPNLKFDHVEIALFRDRIAVFIVRGDQTAVLYDKTVRFPSVNLLASLTLLGSK